MKVYYAHSIALYNTAQEKRDEATLEALGFVVVNPNKPEHDTGYKARGMDYFEDVVRNCAALAFRANPDGSINAGVAREIEMATRFGMQVFELPCGISRRVLTVGQTRSYLAEQGAR
jgi:hypothetical protein